MKTTIRFGLLVVLLVAAYGSLAVQQASARNSHVDVLTIKGDVNPVLSDYLIRGIDTAEKDGAVALVILMNTPGGLISSTQDIINRMIAADVPIVVLVDPWAGSAGTFITMAADVAAMAPVSRIGAASPVSGGGEAMDPVMQKKITQDTAAFIESLAGDKGRNRGAAMAAVIEAASYTSAEALGLDDVEGAQALGIASGFLEERFPGKFYLIPPLVDVEARNLDDLLDKLAVGITLANGQRYALPAVGDASLNRLDMGLGERMLYTLANPNIAYILMSLAMTAIIIEISSPGLVVPGVVGGIALLLAIYALGVLDANFAGIALIVLSFGLFVAEIFTPGVGVLAIGGAISMILGSLMLFRGTPFRVDPWVIAGTVLFFVAVFGFIIYSVLRVQRRPVTTGKEALVGSTGIAQTNLDPAGLVLVAGERWRAKAEDARIQAGDEVRVLGINRLELRVTGKAGGR